MNPDGMSYLDMASEALRGGPRNLVNGYWSPAYPALIGLAFLIVRPSPIQEFPVIHLVNFAVFGFALLSFTFFLKSWLAVRRDEPSSEREKPHLIPFCFCVFLWFTINFIELSVVTPDLCVAGIVFLAAGICCRISLPGSGWRHFAALGAVLSLGYYAKAAMFVLGLVLMAVLFVRPPSLRHSRFKILLSSMVLLLGAAPLIALVSRQVGHLTISETGRLNYAWFANGLQVNAGWTRGDDTHGTPEHPPRTLPGKPTIIEFAEPIKGTYPLWYDPSYWYAGAKVRFDPGAQLAALKASLLYYREAFGQMAILFAGALALVAGGAWRNVTPVPDRNFRWLFPWAITACLMYTVVNAQSRYLGAFFVLSWLALYRLLWRRAKTVMTALVLGFVGGAMFISVAAPSLPVGAKSVREMIRPDRLDYMHVAAALQAAGVGPGDRLATVGYAFDAYYARYIGARVTANVIDADAFRHISAEDLSGVRVRLAGIGVKALVAKDSPVNGAFGDWSGIQVPGSPRYSIMLVPLKGKRPAESCTEPPVPVECRPPAQFPVTSMNAPGPGSAEAPGNRKGKRE